MTGRLQQVTDTRADIAADLAVLADAIDRLEALYARRLGLMREAETVGFTRAEIARMAGLSASSGRITQILGARGGDDERP